MAQSQVQPKMSIPEFYAGKSVFITGGMGFIGKVLVEKILRSCPGVENIYMLCRSKKGKNINERLEEITSSPAFDELREKNPDCFKKIILIEGDVSMLELGISKQDQEILKDKVSIVMHSAATISFNEPLKIAIHTNLRSMRELIKLGKEMRNLKAFMHVSTAYTNWFEMDIKEEMYPIEFDPNEVIELCDKFPEHAINKMTAAFLGRHTNTYTFTKSLAEKLLVSETDNLPTCIIRPSMVGGSMSEPKPGWVDTMGAATLFVQQVGAGIFRSFPHIEGHPFELIPVDKVTNLVIAAAWKVAHDKEVGSPISYPQIYVSSSGAVNKITTKQVFAPCAELGRSHPLSQTIWYPTMRFFSSRKAYDLDVYINHYLPAYFIDLVSKMTGKKPRLMKAQKFIHKNYDDAKFTTSSPYIFQCGNYKNILSLMTQNDQKTFNFDPKNINWKTYMENYYFGMKKFVLKDTNDADLAVRRARITRLKYTKYAVLATAATASLLTIAAVNKTFKNWKRKFQTAH